MTMYLVFLFSFATRPNMIGSDLRVSLKGLDQGCPQGS